MSFSPADFSGLLLWLKADAITGAVDGAALAQWDDQSGNGYHCTQAVAGNRPIYSATGVDGTPEVALCYIDMDGTVQRYLTAPAGVAFNRNNCTIFAVGRPQSRDLTGDSCAVWYATGGATLNFGWGPGCVTAYNGALRTTTATIGYQPHAIGMTSSGTAFKLWLGDTSESFAAANAAAIAGGKIGAGGGLNLYGALKELVIYDHALTDEEYAQLYDYARIRHFSPPNKLLVCDGDSLTTGYGATNNRSYPAQLWGLLGRNWQVYNAAVAGQQTDAMITDGAAEIDPLYSASYYSNILVCWSGVLDLYYGQTPAQAWERINTYCAARQAAGFQVVVCTCLPSGFIDEADRSALNALIRAGWYTCADALADIAADTRIGDAGDNLDPAYYNNSDGNATHMMPAGYAAVAGIVEAEIDELARRVATTRRLYTRRRSLIMTVKERRR
jgi:hypothetical protein